MATIEQRFRELHPTSANLAEEARSVFPEGVTHESRRMDPFPVFMDRGKGTHKWDVDGNEYIDFRTGHGSMILGQAHPSVAAAVHRQMDKGTHLGASTELELRWALLVKQLAPSVEKIRFHSSGTEADMMALKMARVFTGKTKIVKFRDGFHGWSDAAAVRDPDRDRQFGIPPETAASVIVLPDGDLDAVERTLGERDDVAAVILQGDEIIRPEFIRGLRDTTTQHGVLLIVDEVVSGFRWSKAGLHGRFGFTPGPLDLRQDPGRRPARRVRRRPVGDHRYHRQERYRPPWHVQCQPALGRRRRRGASRSWSVNPSLRQRTRGRFS